MRPQRIRPQGALGLRSVLPDGRNLLRRRDVPSWCSGRIVVETEVVSDVMLLRCQAIAAAHGGVSLSEARNLAALPWDIFGTSPDSESLSLWYCNEQPL